MPILLLAAMVLVSTFVTFDLEFSLGKMAGILFGIGVFYATVRAAGRSPRWLSAMVSIYLAGGVGMAGLALVGMRWVDKFPALQPLMERFPQALRGVPGGEAGFHPNEVAGALLWFVNLVLAIGLAALFRVRESRPSRTLAGLGSGMA